jgi:hypothetical protein
MYENLVYSTHTMEGILTDLAMNGVVPPYHISDSTNPFWQRKVSLYLKRDREPHSTLHLLSKIWGFELYEEEDVFMLNPPEILGDAEALITMRYEKAPLELVIPAVLAPTGLDVLVSPQISGLVTVKFSNVPVKDAFNAILEGAGLVGYKRHGVIFVLPSDGKKLSKADIIRLKKENLIISREEEKQKPNETATTQNPLPSIMENFTRIIEKIGSRISTSAQAEDETEDETGDKIMKAQAAATPVSEKTATVAQCVNADVEYSIFQKKSDTTNSNSPKKDERSLIDLTDYENILGRHIILAICDSDTAKAGFNIMEENRWLEVEIAAQKRPDQKKYLLYQKLDFKTKDGLHTFFHNEILFNDGQAHVSALSPDEKLVLRILFEVKE